MRISAPSCLHYQSISGWATYGTVRQKINFSTLYCKLFCIFGKTKSRKLEPNYKNYKFYFLYFLSHHTSFYCVKNTTTNISCSDPSVSVRYVSTGEMISANWWGVVYLIGSVLPLDWTIVSVIPSTRPQKMCTVGQVISHFPMMTGLNDWVRFYKKEYL